MAGACDSCYKRKIQCDAVQPQCNWCHHQNIQCTFTRVRWARKRKSPTGDGNDNSEESTPGNEKISSKYQPNSTMIFKSQTEEVKSSNSDIANRGNGSRDASATTSTPSFPVVGLRKLHFAGVELGFIGHNVIPHLSSRGQLWVQSCTGDIVSSKRLYSLGLLWHDLGESNQVSTSFPATTDMQNQQKIDLPSQEVVEECAAQYLASGLSLIFPLVDVSLFSDTLRIAYGQVDCSHSPHALVNARAFIFAFLALVTTSNVESGKILGHSGESWTSKALPLVPVVLESPPSLNGLQSIVMIIFILTININKALSQTLSGDFGSADTFIGVASRLIFTLGGHVNSPPESTGGDGQPSPSHPISHGLRSDSHLRNLFWICYIIDKDLCVRMGRPPCFHDSECDLTLPEEQDQNQNVSDESISLDPSNTHKHAQSNIIFLSEIRLSILKSRIQSSLYSFLALRKTDTELLRSVRELDAELEQWRVSLPADIRPTVSFSPDPSSSSCHPPGLGAVIIRLEYHHCMGTIHQASSRCQAWVERPNTAMDGVSSSLELSVRASRSLLHYLLAAHHVLSREFFRYITFYPTSAFLTLFCNMLLKPLHASVQGDLKLLEEAPIMLREALELHQLPRDDIHIQHSEELMLLLGSLTRSAVAKARRESDGLNDCR